MPCVHPRCVCYAVPLTGEELFSLGREADFVKYNSDPNYTDVAINRNNWGIKATHKGHNNIRNALKHCAAKPNCDIAIVFCLDKFDNHIIRKGIKNMRDYVDPLNGEDSKKYFSGAKIVSYTTTSQINTGM